MHVRSALPAAALLALALAAAPAQGASTNPAAKWVKSGHRSATLLLVAGESKADSGFNFDGYAKGKLTVTVPLGWTVHVTFRNEGALPHSAMVVAWSTKASAAHPKAALRGAETPNASRGTKKGGHASFSFKASKAGKYRIICAVPGHDAAGMWDTLVVKRGARAASAKA